MEPDPQTAASVPAEPVTPAVPTSVPASSTPPVAAVTRAPRLPSSVVSALVVMGAGGLVAAIAIPHLDLLLTHTTDTPSLLSFVGMAIITILLTGWVLRVAARANLGLSRTWLSLALLYNSVIIMAKFFLAPLSLYIANQQAAFETPQGFGGDANSIGYYILTAVVIGALYMAVFAALRYLAQRPKGRLHISKGNATSLAVGIGAVVVLGIATGGGILIFPLFFGFNALNYMGYVFSTPLAYILVVALIAAAVAAFAALRQSTQDEVASGQTLSTASFFVLGLSLIALYHFLWIVYMLSLVSLWPFKTYTPK